MTTALMAIVITLAVVNILILLPPVLVKVLKSGTTESVLLWMGARYERKHNERSGT